MPYQQRRYRHRNRPQYRYYNNYEQYYYPKPRYYYRKRTEGSQGQQQYEGDQFNYDTHHDQSEYGEDHYYYDESNTNYSHNDDGYGEDHRYKSCDEEYHDDDDYYNYEDEGEYDDEEYYEEPSPLSLLPLRYGKYIKKQLIPQCIFTKIKQNRNKTFTLDVRANAAKIINAWSKCMNISEGIKHSFANNNRQKINILEIGCKNANNFSTYAENGAFIKNYVGIDVSSPPHDHHFSQCHAFGVAFICSDVFGSNDDNLMNHPQIKNKKFDFINIGLSMLHNAFASKLTLLRFLKFLNIFSKEGNAILCCSFVRDDVIHERFDKLLGRTNIFNILSAKDKSESFDKIIFQNRYQSISISKCDWSVIQKYYADEHNDNDTDIVGIAYSYYQMHSLDNIREYLVCFEYFTQMLSAHCNMKLVYRHTANDIFKKYSSKQAQRNDIVVDLQSCSPDERQVIETYGYALFQRKI